VAARLAADELRHGHGSREDDGAPGRCEHHLPGLAVPRPPPDLVE
jgi:hypothetical protein